MSVSKLAKAYTASRIGKDESSSSTTSVVVAPMNLKYVEDNILPEKHAAFLKRFKKFFGKNSSARADKSDRATSIRAAHGTEVLDLLTSLRTMIPFLSLSRPNIRYQPDFNEYIKSIVCGSFFVRNGMMAPAFWTALYIGDVPLGRSGSFSNNQWKAYNESSFKVFNILQAELMNPSMIGTAMYSKYSLCYSMMMDHSRVFYPVQVLKQTRILDILNIDCFQDNSLVFRPSTSSSTGEGSLFLDFIKQMGICSDDHWTIGLFIFIHIFICFVFML
jgi:hypothetical protein